MGKWTNGQMDKWISYVSRHKNRKYKDEPIGRQIDTWTDRQIHGQIDRYMDRQIDTWTVGPINRHNNLWILNKQIGIEERKILS